MNKAGSGYLSGNRLVAFPFEDGQLLDWEDGIDAEFAQQTLQKCFVDASVSVCLNTVSGGWPSLCGFAFGKSSSNGSEVEDRRVLTFYVEACGKRAQLKASASSDAYPIISGSSDFGWYSVTMCSEGLRELSELGPSSFDLPDAESSMLRLCPRCFSQLPAELTSFRVYNGYSITTYDTSVSGYSVGDLCRYRRWFFRCMRSVSAGAEFDSRFWKEVGFNDMDPDFTLTGDVSVIPGNNLSLTEPDSEHGIELNAIAGAGLGTLPCDCESSVGISTQLKSEDGHVRLFNDTCYDIEPSIETEGGKTVGILRMHEKCTACCTCDMYASIVNDKLKPLADEVRLAKTKISEELEDYEDSVSKFNARISKPELSDVTLSLTGMPVGKNISSNLSNGSVSGKMERCAFSAVVRNSSYSTVKATVCSLAGTDSVVDVTASWTDEDGEARSLAGDSADELYGTDFSISPGKSLIVNFVSRIDADVSGIFTSRYSGSISVSLSYVSSSGDLVTLGILNKSAEVV